MYISIWSTGRVQGFGKVYTFANHVMSYAFCLSFVDFTGIHSDKFHSIAVITCGSEPQNPGSTPGGTKIFAEITNGLLTSTVLYSASRSVVLLPFSFSSRFLSFFAIRTVAMAICV